MGQGQQTRQMKLDFTRQGVYNSSTFTMEEIWYWRRGTVTSVDVHDNREVIIGDGIRKLLPDLGLTESEASALSHLN